MTADGPERTGIVIAVSRAQEHVFSKPNEMSIRLIEGLGVEGDAHLGATVKHRSRVAKDPTQPNLRQVHLIHSELHEELAPLGFRIFPGAMGENITTRGVDILNLPTATRLHLGESAIVEITGLRNPCAQLDGLQPGLMNACVFKGDDGAIVRKAGVMSIVIAGGDVRPGDAIRVELPAKPHRALEVV